MFLVIKCSLSWIMLFSNKFTLCVLEFLFLDNVMFAMIDVLLYGYSLQVTEWSTISLTPGSSKPP